MSYATVVCMVQLSYYVVHVCDTAACNLCVTDKTMKFSLLQRKVYLSLYWQVVCPP